MIRIVQVIYGRLNFVVQKFMYLFGLVNLGVHWLDFHLSRKMINELLFQQMSSFWLYYLVHGIFNYFVLESCESLQFPCLYHFHGTSVNLECIREALQHIVSLLSFNGRRNEMKILKPKKGKKLVSKHTAYVNMNLSGLNVEFYMLIGIIWVYGFLGETHS